VIVNLLTITPSIRYLRQRPALSGTSALRTTWEPSSRISPDPRSSSSSSCRMASASAGRVDERGEMLLRFDQTLRNSSASIPEDVGLPPPSGLKSTSCTTTPSTDPSLNRREL